jgi:hypothetical protein
MSTRTKHNYAVFDDEGVIVVEVKKKHVEKYGEEALWNSIQDHPMFTGDDWDDSDDWHVVIAYWDDDEPYFFGDEEVVEFVAEIPVEEMPWEDEKLPLDWEDD